MTFPMQHNSYSIAQGASPSTNPVFADHDPTSSNTNYPIQQRWINTQTQAIWVLESLSSAGGVVNATWRALAPIVLKTTDPTSGVAGTDYLYPLGQPWLNTTTKAYWILVGVSGTTPDWDLISSGGTGAVITLTGNSGAAVPATSGNINIVGDGTSITISGNPGTSTLTASLVGGGTAIDSFVPDSGTNPVVPTGAGAVTMSGSGSITTVGGTNTLTTQLTGLTKNAVLVGAGTSTITKVGPSSGVGYPLISEGSSTDPQFSTTFQIDETNLVASFSASSASKNITLLCSNTSASNQCTIQAHGAYNGYFSSGNTTSPQYWNFGMVPITQNFNITTSSGVGDPSAGTVAIQALPAGVVNLPNQPFFFARLQTSDANATGNGADYRLGSGNALTLSQEQGSPSGIATNGIYTVPATGVYQFSFCLQVTGISAAMTNGRSWLLFSPGSAIGQGSCFNPASVVNVGGAAETTFTGTSTIKLSTGDTVEVHLMISNGVGNTATVSGAAGSTGNSSWFCGIKIA